MYTALADTSRTIKHFLEAQLQAFLTGARIVSLNSPVEMQDAGGGQQGLSVWLYRVERDSELLNLPRERLSPGQLRHEPLPLRLHYLVTPLLDTASGAAETEQEMLGRVLQSFHDHPMLEGAHLQGGFQNTTVKLRIRLESMNLDETSKLRDMLKLDKPYQLAVSYEVSVVNIDSAQPPTAVSPVTVVMPGYGLIVAENGS
jgi:hypothetical protein